MRKRFFETACLSILVLFSVLAASSGGDEIKHGKDQLSIGGMVVDERGAPLAGASVWVEWHKGRDDVVSDRAGRFKLTVPSERIAGRLVRASADGGRRQAQHQLPWEDSAAGGDIKLELRPARRVELHVIDGDGRPVPGAKAGIRTEYHSLSDGKTDEGGRVRFDVAHDAHVAFIYALEHGHGFDYRAFVLPFDQRGDKNAKPPALPDGPITLALDGTRPLRVRVVESDDTPLEGLTVYPWLLKKPDQPEDINLSYFVDTVKATTDSEGVAVFDWIPHWQEQLIQLWPVSDDHARQRGTYDPKTGDGALTIKLERLTPIGGRVTFADGSPAAGMTIAASGNGYSIDSFREEVRTDANGRYTIKAAPNMVYLLIVKDDKRASQPQTGFAVWPGKPLGNLDFVLRPATRIFGRVMLGAERKPVKGQPIYVYQYGQDANNMEGVELPNPEESNLWVQPIIVHSTSSDENGEYELFVGGGKFDIRGPQQSAVEKFEIVDEPEKEFNFHAERPEKGILAGMVVDAESQEPVAGARVVGIYRHDLAGRDMLAETDEAGRFEVERELHRTVIHARSSDKKLAGVVEIGPDDETAMIAVQPMATANGRLIDARNSLPLAGREIVYSVKVPLGDDDAHWRPSFGGKAMTNKDGAFSLTELVVGQRYEISATVHVNDDPNNVSWRGVGNVTPEDASQIDLGDLRLAPLRLALTPAERAARAFAVTKTPVERFEAALADAKISRQQILVLFAAADNSTAKRILELRYEDDVLSGLFDHFQVLAIDKSGENQAGANELASRLQIDVENRELPFLLVVAEADGKALAEMPADALSLNGEVQKEMLQAVLKANSLEPLDANALLAEALRQAKADNKRVIVQETATWCGPCWLLSRFLEKHKQVWQDDYILVKMDHRWTGAQEIMKDFRGEADGGIPWFAVLDAEGKILITSNGADGNNIGYPSEESGQAHFRKMLETTAQRLTPAEIASLIDALRGGQANK
ncbi:MAG TPA: carboxypeptidase regulatory-like domain-containing protein [Lacipirellulaceae bacterium]